MNATTPRPGDYLTATLKELLDLWHTHLTPLVNARYAIGEPQPVDQLRDSALHLLATGEAMVDALQTTRWVTVAEALSYGAPLDAVAAAMGLDEDEIVFGLRSWADAQVDHGLMPGADRDQIYALVEGGDR